MLLTVPIREILPATPRARIVRLDLGDRLFSYRAGQAVAVSMHGQARRTPYSLAAAPEDAVRDRCLELLVGVDDSGSPGSPLTLEPGEAVDVEGPIGNFTFPDDAGALRFLFLAGGTGIAPLRAMIRHAIETGRRGIGLFYSARTPLEFAYEPELRELAGRGLLELRQTVTRATADGWRGARGRIGKDDLAPLVHDPRTLCFVCGPPSLVDEIPRLLGELGIPRERIRLEEWG